MSQEKVNPRLIKSNIDHLQKIVKRPAVTEKILSRPPFRFIFDLTTMIIKTTGYLRGLYTEDEFSWDNVSANKDTKMAFLDKLIDVIGLINSKPIDCKSAKIVAGVEVEKTNKLLLELAKCVEDKKPFLEAVEKVRKGFKPETGSSSGSVSNVNSKTLTKSSLNKKTAPVKQATVTTKVTNKTSPEPGTSKASKTGSGKPSSGQTAKVVDVPEKSQPITATTMMVDDIDMATNDDDDDEANANGINDGSIVRRPSTTTKSLESYRNENEPPPPQQGEAEAPDDILVVDNHPHEDTINGPTMIKNLVDGEELSLVPSSPSPETIPNGDNSAKVEYDRQPEPTVAAPSADKKINQGSADTTTKEDHHPNKLVTSNEIRTNDDNDVDDDGGGDYRAQPPPPPQPSTPAAAAAANDIVNNKRLKSSSVTVGGGGGRSARPKSSRPAPPRVMTASRSRLNQLMENSGGNSAAAATNGGGVASGGSGASAASNVWIPETVDDGDDEFLISSQKLQESFLSMDGDRTESRNIETEQTTATSKGHLVQQLMATQSELEGQIKANHQSINGDQLNSVGKPINVIDDTNQLRNQIQALCQSIGTLTKAMGYLHEDVGPMLDERRKWQTECQTNQEQIERIRSDMAKDMEPLRKELSMVERQVEDYQERIHSTKSNIYRNEQIISKLIDSV